MNYIKELENDRVALLRAIIAMEDGLQCMVNHTLLPKFHEDTTMQVQDIRNWIDYVRMEANGYLKDLSDRKVKHE